MGLEELVKDSLKGLASGAIVAADPLGSAITYYDCAVTGRGPSDPDAVSTIPARTYRAIYPDYSRGVTLRQALPRLAGFATGAASVAGLGFGLLRAGYPDALLMPVALGMVSGAALAGRGARYVLRTAQDAYESMRETSDAVPRPSLARRIKGTLNGSLEDALKGASYGFHRVTNFDWLKALHFGEMAAGGPGVSDSYFKSTIQQSAKEMPRTVPAYFGAISCALVAGAAVAGLAYVGYRRFGTGGALLGLLTLPAVNLAKGAKRQYDFVREQRQVSGRLGPD